MSPTSTDMVDGNKQELVISHPGTEEPNGISTLFPVGGGSSSKIIDISSPSLNT